MSRSMLRRDQRLFSRRLEPTLHQSGSIRRTFLPTLPSPSQSRWSSSNAHSNRAETIPETNTTDVPISETQQDSSPRSRFGFQSLSSLLRPALSARYNKPADESSEARGSAVNTELPLNSINAVATQSDVAKDTREIHSTRSGGSDTITAPSYRPLSRNKAPGESAQARIRKQWTGRPAVPAPLSGNNARTLAVEFQRKNNEARDREPSGNAVRNPFVSRRVGVRRVDPTKPLKTERPWGLSREDGGSAISKVGDGTVLGGGKLASGDDEPSPMDGPNARAPSTGGVALTHVKSSGEAYMVDVSSKPATRRIAIAYAVVQFCTVEAHRLILEDKNKKGDVLGVARVAGIMAAKRTSDLIPLCHPIAISKTELDVDLRPPLLKGNGSNERGAVVIEARVECVGPTGVEMEALTAAMGAALTVYDMCKAVDRKMRIYRGSVVYKSGGRSGLFVDGEWAASKGRQYFVDHGLEMLEKAPSQKSGKVVKLLPGRSLQ